MKNFLTLFMAAWLLYYYDPGSKQWEQTSSHAQFGECMAARSERITKFTRYLTKDGTKWFGLGPGKGIVAKVGNKRFRHMWMCIGPK